MNYPVSRTAIAASLLLSTIAFHARGADEPATAPATQPAATAPAGLDQAGNLPHLRIDPEHKTVDLEATVVLREGGALELLACTPGTREYESILSVEARPSHVHLALLMIGLQPGSPMRWESKGEKVTVVKPSGPPVAVSIIMDKDGKSVEVPAGQWILNQKTKKTLENSDWIFAGSVFDNLDGKQVYRADLNGSVISVVSFGDEVLCENTEMTNMNDNETWGCNTAAIPPVGTKVTLRLRALKAAATQPAATWPASTPTTQPAPSP